MTVLSTSQAQRPQWRDEYLRDVPALLQHCERVQAWQRTSDDPFERADAALWSRLTAFQAQHVFCGVINIFALCEDQIGSGYRDECAARLKSGARPINETQFREHLARVLAQHIALATLPAAKA
jgi:hypothetical protein